MNTSKIPKIQDILEIVKIRASTKRSDQRSKFLFMEQWCKQEIELERNGDDNQASGEPKSFNSGHEK